MCPAFVVPAAAGFPVGIAAVRPPPPPTGVTVYYFTAVVTLPFERSIITETDFIQRPLRNAHGQLMKDPENEASSVGEAGWVQIEGNATFNNTPLTWITVSAGVAVITDPTWGASRATIEDGIYTSNPIERAATLAGVGLGLLWLETPPGDKIIGDAVVTTGDQLVHEPSWMLMIGGVYRFGG